jgi:hypothetical protein
MVRHGIPKIVSADLHVDCVPGIERIDPSAFRAPA